jgi:toxin CptA
MTTAEPDVHQFEEILQPIPESVRTTRVSGQFWIWAGANIAPINWVLGAPGIGLGLCDTLIVLLAGNVVGMALFGVVRGDGPADGRDGHGSVAAQALAAIENGHVDAQRLSWLAGGMVAAALYALLGLRMRRQESLADLAGNLIP